MVQNFFFAALAALMLTLAAANAHAKTPVSALAPVERSGGCEDITKSNRKTSICAFAKNAVSAECPSGSIIFGVTCSTSSSKVARDPSKMFTKYLREDGHSFGLAAECSYTRKSGAWACVTSTTTITIKCCER